MLEKNNILQMIYFITDDIEIYSHDSDDSVEKPELKKKNE